MTMGLKNITDQALIQQTTGLVRQERELLKQVLEHLREIDRRRLFASLGYKSLFEFASKHLGYSEEAAYRRIQAMRVLQQLPEIEAKLENGEVQLTHLSLAQKFFRKEAQAQNQPVSKELKLELINKLAGTSVREAEKILIQESSCPQELRPERIKVVTPSHVEVRLTLTQETLDQIEVLKGWIAHKHPNLSMSELFSQLCELGLKEWSPAKEPKRGKKAPSDEAEASSISVAQRKSTQPGEQPSPSAQRKIRSAHPRALPAATRRLVFQRAGNRCENCLSRYALQIDHIQPVARSGTADPSNLRLLCRSCNQRAAIEVFGVKKMETHLRRDDL
jgi:5-methylcytosine-specific restriction endonuclease McrA